MMQDELKLWIIKMNHSKPWTRKPNKFHHEKLERGIANQVKTVLRGKLEQGTTKWYKGN